MQERYTMYIDECGDANMPCKDHNRFLCLTGIIISLDEDKKLKETIKNFKSKFNINNVILHRQEIIRSTGNFKFLQDKKIRDIFDDDLLKILKNTKYNVISSLIDKQEFQEKYQFYRNTYHYLLEIMIERFAKFLINNNSIGTIYIEARGKKEDYKLKKVYKYFLTNGTSYMNKDKLSCITNSEIKFETKRTILQKNICAFELCDIIANPSMHYIREMYNLPFNSKQFFSSKILTILKDEKFIRGEQGKLKGYGIKKLP